MRYAWCGAVACVIGGWWCTLPVLGDLSEYVKSEDSAFSWKSVNHTVNETGTVYTLHMVSQRWQNLSWEHTVTIYQAPQVRPQATMLLWVTGGKPNPISLVMGMELSRLGQTPVAFLYDIPNQPLLNGKREDALIAESFVRYLQTGDESWPLLFPMVKSVVRAMDALQEFARREWKIEVRHFVIAGASKRGWTSWLTASLGDPRVKAIAPMVIDVLNMPEQLEWQLRSLGGYSQMLRDYIDAGLVPMPQTERARRLWSMVDPYVYRQRFVMPKLIVLGSNDPYWSTDALNLYWDSLPDPKWVVYVPNAGHDLRDRQAELVAQLQRPLNTLGVFLRHHVYDNSLPTVTWQYQVDSTTATLDIRWKLGDNSKTRLTAARLWVAEAPTRDFRQATWKAQNLPCDDKVPHTRGRISLPAQGCRALFGELEFQEQGRSYWLSTQIRIVGTPMKP
ncbi:MAG: PhoPQ-activated protein PqaA family protein [Gemmatales bacterium]|nr:PhoPQ-activated pathogenicity-related family protein [Gemmatales bacterium]MDW8174629.1 PhoPQ-activated protein PqaA family protein [Gemmatales bacterium]